jgi:hypothetical protein
MNQTDTPLKSWKYSSDPKTELACLLSECRQALAKANADKAVLVEALEKIAVYEEDSTYNNREVARDALSQVRLDT